VYRRVGRWQLAPRPYGARAQRKRPFLILFLHTVTDGRQWTEHRHCVCDCITPPYRIHAQVTFDRALARVSRARAPCATPHDTPLHSAPQCLRCSTELLYNCRDGPITLSLHQCSVCCSEHDESILIMSEMPDASAHHALLTNLSAASWKNGRSLYIGRVSGVGEPSTSARRTRSN
jgi:hypothetical protein